MLIAVLSTVATASALAIQPLPHGQPPRFVNPEWWERRDEFAEPREPAVILAELDGLPGTIEAPAPGSGAEAFDNWRGELDRLLRRRADLISELEQSGYNGPRLPELLLEKVDAVTQITSHTLFPHNWWAALRSEIAERHPGTRAAAYARLAGIAELSNLLVSNGLSVSDSSLERIAELELEALDPADPSEAGKTLFYIARRSGEQTLRRWQDWMIANLPEGSRFHAMARTERMFGREIRLTGTDFDGSAVDTADWRGEVVLVDFWGSWCNPCTGHMPELVRLVEEFGPRGFRILGVSYDDPDDSRAFLAEHPEYAWPQIAGERTGEDTILPFRNDIVAEYGVEFFPTYWLIDRAGRVHKVPDRYKLREQIGPLLRENPLADDD